MKPKQLTDKLWCGYEYPETPHIKIGTGELINGVPTWDFDVSVYCGLFSITRLSIYGWKDYVKSTPKNEYHTLKTPEESFLSLHGANGIYFVNPMEKPTTHDFCINGNLIDECGEYHDDIEYQKAFRAWNKMESKTIKGKLIYFETI